MKKIMTLPNGRLKVCLDDGSCVYVDNQRQLREYMDVRPQILRDLKGT